MVEDNDSDQGMKSSNNNRQVFAITARSSLRALLYKSAKLQQHNICANICQVLTPLLCVLFTLVIRLIASQIVTMQVQIPQFPRPLSLPILYDLLPLNLSCQEIYLYHSDGSNQLEAQKLLNRNLKHYCSRTNSLQPSYTFSPKMNDQVMEILTKVNEQPFESGKEMEGPIPDGLIDFHTVSLAGKHKSIEATVSINDYRLSQYHRNNGVTKIAVGDNFISYVMTTEGMMGLIEKITRPFLQEYDAKQILMGSYMYMPFKGEDVALLDKTVNVVGSGLYPLGLSLLLPLFLYAIISEKEDKLIEAMRMNGLDIRYYWVSTFIFNFGLSMLTFAIFFIFGRYVLDLTFFTQTHAGLMWLTLVGWAIAQIGLTNLVQIFISNSKSATIVGYLLSIFGSLVGETLAVFIYAFPMQPPFALMLFPPFCMCRIVYLMGLACSSTGCFSEVFSSGQEVLTCITILYMWFWVFVFSVWLDGQVQQEYGVAHQSKLLAMAKRYLLGSKKQQQQQDFSLAGEFELKEEKEMGAKASNKRDSSVDRMKEKIELMGIDEKNLITKGLMKKYPTNNGKQDYVALKPFSCYIEDKEIFGLLGPNGAGKTTLISVLTGMYPKSEGNAWINGIKVGEGKVNEHIGVCPQFDLLWPTLTVYQHLKFYTILKGIATGLVEASIDESLHDVDLFEWRDTPSKELSGGMQRRLSIAIALVGNPSVVFLDQPSSGLDPSHRRKMWDILLRCKNKSSIILTTHLMEQAEALCERVGIISKGQLRCVGKTKDLKESFGEGYRLHINFTDLLSPNNEKIVEELVGEFGARVVSRLERRVVVAVEKERVLECVRRVKQEGSVNWLVSQPSLHDVFMNFVE